MESNTPTFSLIGEELIKGHMDEPTSEVPWEDHDLYDRIIYQRKMEEYEAWEKLPKSIPIAPGSKWAKTTGLVEGKDFFIHNSDTFYWIKCEKCGWEGSSEYAAGGGPIADTGDYDDSLCPNCFSTKIEANPTVEIEDHNGLWAYPATLHIIPAPSPGEVDSLQQSATKAAILYSSDRYKRAGKYNISYGSFIAGVEWQRSQRPDPDALAVELVDFLLQKVANGEMVIMDGGELFLTKKGWIYWEESDGEMPITASRLVQIFKQQKEANK